MLSSKNKRFFSVCVVACMLILIAVSSFGCSSPSSPSGSGGAIDAPAGNQYFTIATASVGGSWFPLGASVAAYITKEVPGVVANAITGEGISNIYALDSGEVQMATLVAAFVGEAWEGVRTFDKPMRNMRSLGVMYTGPFEWVVPADSDIWSIADLKDKKVDVGAIGSMAVEHTKWLFDQYGFDFESIRAAGGDVFHSGHSEAAELMRDGHTDCALFAVASPSAPVTEISMAFPVRVLEYEQEILDKRLPGYGVGETPAGAYRGHDKTVKILTYANMLGIHVDVDEETAYQITKTIYENLEDITAGVPTVQEMWKIENIFEGNPIPFHPGAVRYFEEIGLDIPEEMLPY